MEKNLTLVPSSMLSTVSALGAQNMGAGKYDRADQILRCAMGIAVGFGVCVAVLIQFIAEPVVGLFTTDTMVVILGAQYIRGYIWDCIFAGVHLASVDIFALTEGRKFHLFIIWLPFCVSVFRGYILLRSFSRIRCFLWDWQQRRDLCFP